MRRVQFLHFFAQPLRRLRQALNGIKCAFDHLAKTILVAVAAVGLQKLVKLRVIRFKKFLEQLVHRLSTQDHLSAVIANLKIRLHVDEVKKATDHFECKCVKGADIRVWQKIQLSF